MEQLVEMTSPKSKRTCKKAATLLLNSNLNSISKKQCDKTNEALKFLIPEFLPKDMSNLEELFKNFNCSNYEIDKDF